MAPHAITPPRVSSPGTRTSQISVLASSRAAINGQLTEATIVVSQVTGKIISVTQAVVPESHFPSGTSYKDYSPLILMPGLVDAHVHLNEPGRTEWEGFWTGTRAAAFGGVTTVVDMPLNAIPPTTTVAGFREKIAAARGKCWVDVGFYGGMIPGNAHELIPLVEMGVRGFKGFLIDSGVPEFPAVSSEDIELAMRTLADSPTVLMFHAEMIPPITDSVGDDVQVSLPPLQPTGPLTSYQTFLDSRPPSFETYAISQILSLAPLAPSLPLHIVHLSAVEAIPLLRGARARGANITAETCFHYLSLAAERIKEGDTRHKCCPPIRPQDNQDGLWAELLRSPDDDPVIKTVVSDHSPCTPNLKLLPAAITPSDDPPRPAPRKGGDADGDFFAAWGGISSVGLGLPILYTELARRLPAAAASSAASLARAAVPLVARWCAEDTAAQVGLAHRKGRLAPGFDADVCVFDDAGGFVVERDAMLFRNRCSPYEGVRLRGVVRETWVRGRRVYERGEGARGFDEKGGPVGELLLERREFGKGDGCA